MKCLNVVCDARHQASQLAGIDKPKKKGSREEGGWISVPSHCRMHTSEGRRASPDARDITETGCCGKPKPDPGGFPPRTPGWAGKSMTGNG